MKSYTITVSDEVAQVLEVAAMGMDDMHPEPWLAEFLTRLAHGYLQRKDAAAVSVAAGAEYRPVAARRPGGRPRRDAGQRAEG